MPEEVESDRLQQLSELDWYMENMMGAEAYMTKEEQIERDRLEQVAALQEMLEE